MNCKNCNQELIENAKFCGKCGKPTGDQSTVKKQTDTIIKCGNCDYIGPGEPARRTISKVLAWMCVVIAPLITILYFVSTHKYKCPKCKSTFIGIKNEEGVFTSPKGGSGRVVKIILFVLLGIFITGILASIVLASLNSARQKAKEAQGIGSTELTYEVMQQVVNDINKEYPKMIDTETRIDSVSGAENTLSYHFTLINYSLADIDVSELNDKIKGGLINLVCTTPEMQIYVKNKAVINYTYYDKEGSFITNVPVNTGSDCK